MLSRRHPRNGGSACSPTSANKEHHYKSKTWTYDQLVEARKGENLTKQIELPVWRERHAACRKALGTLAQVFSEVKPDVAVIVGNDQKEIFRDAYTPAISVFYGKTIVNTMFSDERIAALPPGIAVAIAATPHRAVRLYPGRPSSAATSSKPGRRRVRRRSPTHLPQTNVPHAFGFVYRQIMRDQACRPYRSSSTRSIRPISRAVALLWARRVARRAIESWKSMLAWR